MNRISAVIITHNEERNIERCLASLADVVDEVVVIDSYSDDRTPEICRSFNVRFEQRPWKGYSDQKNFGNNLASHPWVFSIDADEALSDELKSSLQEFKNQQAVADAYIVNRLTNYCGSWIKHCGWYPDRKMRLWKKELGRWQGHIHEEVKLNTGATMLRLSGDLLHYSYYTIKDHLKQIDLFTDLMAEDNVAKQKGGLVWRILISPTVKFFDSYFFRLGILDGYAGFVVSLMSSYATFLKYVKTRELAAKS
jgi:glycosyltransferase involved in cell wall biosynthesis